jgi:membrane protease YdiL (CAAX protease family)
VAAQTRFIQKHPVAAYFAIAFAISWGGGLLAIGTSGAMRGTTPVSDPRFVYALIAMLAGPSVAGVLMTWLVSGRTGLRAFRSRLLAWRIDAKWYAAAILTAPLAMLATLAALAASSPAFTPGILVADDRTSLLLVSLAIGVSAGLFEELGWTGFAIPAMRRRHGGHATGFVVGIVWSAWHLLPNIWSSRAAAGDLPMSLYLWGTALGIFVGYLTAFRILMVWVYDATRSTLLAMLMHVSLTASLLVLNPLRLAGANLMVYSFALAGVLWIAVAAVAQSRWVREQSSRPRAA